MADISDRLKIAQQLAFLQAGGGKKPVAQQIAEMLTGVGVGLGVAGEGLGSGTEALKKSYETKKLKQELSPIRTLFGVPSEEEEQSIKDQLFTLPQAKRSKVVDDIVRQMTQANLPPEEISSLTEEELMGKGYNIPPEPEPFISKRSQLQKQFGDVPIDLPVGQAKELAAAKALAGTVTLYLDKDSGAVGITPTVNSIPIARVSEKQAANILAGKERANIVAGGAEQRQQKTFGQQEKLQEKSQTFQEKMKDVEEGNKRESERLRVDAGAKEKYITVKDNLRLAKQIEDGLKYAIDNKINITGLIDLPMNVFKEAIGTLPKEKQDILTDIRRNFAQFGRQMGGTAFTATEKSIFAPIMPRTYLPETTNLNRVSKAREELQKLIKTTEEVYPGLVEVIQKGGLKGETSGGLKLKVSVFNPQGEEGLIPVAQLDEAVKQGFRPK